MKKLICLLLLIILIFLLCGCKNQNTESLKFSQEVTIVTMSSPPKCKTTNSISVVNEVIDVLTLIEKSPTKNNNVNGGYKIMIKLKIDDQELVYTIGSVFTDTDGRQYTVSNYEEIEAKLTKIYNELDVPEVDYS